MAFSPTDAAKEIIRRMGLTLDSAGFSNLKNAFNGSPPTGYNINTAYAPVDGWLQPAVQAQATTFAITDGVAIDSLGFVTLSNSAYTFTPYCPRPTLLMAQISGYSTGTGIFGYRVTLDGTSVISGKFGINTANVHTTFPMLQVVIPAGTTAGTIKYPLVSQVLRFQIDTPAGGNFNMDGNDVISYSLS